MPDLVNLHKCNFDDLQTCTHTQLNYRLLNDFGGQRKRKIKSTPEYVGQMLNCCILNLYTGKKKDENKTNVC